MLIFHEGLPGSGKSYEAMTYRIIPALQKGRRVIAYIEGLNFERIAEASELPVEKVRELLKPLTRDQVEAGIVQLAEDNALMVLDEAQNFWGNRAKLDKQTTEFVTEHRHRGIDLVLMGQDLRDVHTLWRRRIEFKVCFLKLSSLGLGKRYTVTTWRHLGQDKFERVGTKTGKYDPKFFGTYASHTSTEVNTEDYKDKRATVWASGLMTLGIPAVVVAGAVGVWFLWGYFHPQPVQQAAKSAAQGVKTASVGAGAPVPGPAASASSPKNDTRSPQERRFADLSQRFRIRLAGLVSGATRASGIVEWIDGGSRVMERLSLDQLRELGVAVVIGQGVTKLAMGEWSDLATMWPLEADGRISENRLQSMRPTEAGAHAPEPAGLATLGRSPVVVAGRSETTPDDKAPPPTTMRPPVKR
jgi:zona occludens toxin